MRRRREEGEGLGLDEEGRSQQQAKHMDIFMSIIF